MWYSEVYHQLDMIWVSKWGMPQTRILMRML
jgi:hypothetical protein